MRFSETAGGPYLARAEANSVPPLVKLPLLLSAAEKFMSDSESAADLKLLLAPGSSLGGARPERDLEELWRRMVFGVMISNTDNHLRNHGFLYAGAGWALSPAYDLNPNTEKTVFATAVDSAGENNTVDSALKTAASFRLSNRRAKEIAEQVKTAVAGWREAAKKFKLPEREIGRMRGAFAV